MKENRRFYRMHQVIRVVWRGEGIVSLGFTHDISQAGAFIMTERNTPPGAVIELDFRPVASPPIRTTGTVAWASSGEPRGLPRGIGVSFPREPRMAQLIDGLMARGY